MSLHRIKKKVNDQQVEIKVSAGQAPFLIKPVKDPTFNYNSTFHEGRRARSSFEPPEYNLAEINRAADVDGYVARSFDKKNALMFKEGWSLIGKNPRTIKYIKIRFAQIASATKVPTELLLRKIGDGLVRKSNSFVAKVRDIKSSGGKVRTLPGTSKSLKPVAGYFVPPAETFEFRMNRNEVDRWQQRMPYGQTKEFDIDDISHFYYNKKDGFIFGTPTLVPALDDVRALRKIEENIELLIYQHLFPLFQWKVGTKEAPAGTTEKGEREVDIVRQEIQYLPTEGGIVTTERHEIQAIGAEGRALRAEGYLTHFKRRVFSDLDMSPIDFGESESSNRSTAEQLSQNLIDRVKDFQRVMEGFVNEHLIKELLLESDFPFDPLEEDNIVRFKFKEIDLELQIKKDSHYADLYAKNTIGLNEARIGMERDPVLLPTPEEIDNGLDGPEKYPQWYEFFWNLIEKPKALIQAVDEPYSSVSKAALAAKEKSEEELSIKRAQAEKPAARSVKNMALRDAFLSETYKEAKTQIVDYITNKKETNVEFISQIIRAALTPAIDKMNSEQVAAFRKGYAKFGSTSGSLYIEAVSIARVRFKERAQFYIDKLIQDISNSLRRNIKQSEPVAPIVDSVFSSFKFRTSFIEDVELRKANSYGSVIGMRLVGIQNSIVEGKGESCESCQNHIGEILDNRYITLNDIPPYHNACDCFLKSHYTQQEVSDSVEKTSKYDKNIEDSKKLPSPRMANCIQRMRPILKRDNPSLSSRDLDAFAEAVCRGRMNDEQNIEDAPDKLERCVLQAKKSLRKQHPSWSAEKIKSTAYAVCQSRLKGK